MKLGNILIEKGQRWQGELKVTDNYSMPMYGICGEEEGKTLVVTAGVHGCEYVGVQTARKLWKSLDSEQMKGQVIILPLVNQYGFYEGAKQIVPEDGENLNRVFPGKVDGTLAQKIAYVIEKEIYPHADFLIDLHGGDSNEAMEPLVFFPVAAESFVNDISREAASYLPVTYRVCSTAKNGLYSYATQKGIPALLLEIGGEGKWKKEEVEHCEKCVYDLMRYLNILQDKVVKKEQKEIIQAIYDKAEINGFWYPMIKPGQSISKGDVLGEICDLEGHTLKQYIAQLEGEVLYHTTALGIKKGDPLIAYGAY